MAKYGTRYPVYAPFDEETAAALPTYQTGKVLGKLASVNVSLNIPESEYYADDDIAEEVAEFVSGDGELECDNISDDNLAELYGAAKDQTTSEVGQGADDRPPYFGFGFLVTKMIRGEKKFVGHFYPKCKAKPGGIQSQTKGESITFTGEPFTFKIFNPLYGKYHYFKTFADETSAKSWINTKLNVSSSSTSGGATGD